MNALSIALVVLQMITCVVVIAVVLIQSGKSSGLSSALSGSSETFLSKNKSRSLDARLAKYTKWVAILFVILTLTLNFIL